MWTCRRCQAQYALIDVKATLDAEGFNFVCPVCQHHNKLVNVGTDHLRVVQPDIDWDDFKARE